ncbi:hypothetical protein Poli38472_008699 [Pythium oligandrum]|uniref:non-specific serine/threonine protein kinase n=1 Tax=Pythium oligandrum TaxID=41045 RepID=A0A8K1C417_PYTOL|nr:hypothetical protein Poli38472_008699 [Pythium oligandrum]|eukprot:TMW56051.1 hypothetical protein Poli38472_008699 [Pythium oligandrum]
MADSLTEEEFPPLTEDEEALNQRLLYALRLKGDENVRTRTGSTSALTESGASVEDASTGTDLWEDESQQGEKNELIAQGVTQLMHMWVASRRQNIYKPFRHSGLPGLPRFTLKRPVFYFSTRPVESEESKSDELVLPHLQAVFFDPIRHTPSNKVHRLTHTGIVNFAYYFAVAVNPRTAEPRVRVFPVAFQTMDRAQLAAQHQDTTRMRNAMEAVRREGFRKKRLSLFDSDVHVPLRHAHEYFPHMEAVRREGFRKKRLSLFDSDVHVPLRHAHEYFPQWTFMEDGDNQYLLTDFAFNGNLVLYAQKRIRFYSMEIAHLAAESGIIVDNSVMVPALNKLWREEALSIFVGISRAVAFMHSRQVCHLDLGPHTIEIDAQLNPVIGDFSSAELMGSDHLVGQGRAILCHRHFCDPAIMRHNRSLHQSAGVNGKAADMFSLGALLYWLLFLRCVPGDKATVRYVNPMESDAKWLNHLIEHIAGYSTNHDQCAICQSSHPLPAEISMLFQGLLVLNPSHRLLAHDLLRVTSRFDQLEGDIHVRCERVFQGELAKHDGRGEGNSPIQEIQSSGDDDILPSTSSTDSADYQPNMPEVLASDVSHVEFKSAHGSPDFQPTGTVPGAYKTDFHQVNPMFYSTEGSGATFEALKSALGGIGMAGDYISCPDWSIVVSTQVEGEELQLSIKLHCISNREGGVGDIIRVDFNLLVGDEKLFLHIVGCIRTKCHAINRTAQELLAPPGEKSLPFTAFDTPVWQNRGELYRGSLVMEQEELEELLSDIIADVPHPRYRYDLVRHLKRYCQDQTNRATLSGVLRDQFSMALSSILRDASENVMRLGVFILLMFASEGSLWSMMESEYAASLISDVQSRAAKSSTQKIANQVLDEINRAQAANFVDNESNDW